MPARFDPHLLNLAHADNAQSWKTLQRLLAIADESTRRTAELIADANFLCSHDMWNVHQAVRTIRDQETDPAQRLQVVLIRPIVETGIVATYCRAYGRNRGVIPKLPIPRWLTSEERELHNKLHNLRNKVYVHTDHPHPARELLTGAEARERLIEAIESPTDRETYRAALDGSTGQTAYRTELFYPLSDVDLERLEVLSVKSAFRHSAVSGALRGVPYPFPTG